MKLYYFSRCVLALAAYRAARGRPAVHAREKVDIRSEENREWRRIISTINSKGAVPALELDDGAVLTEGRGDRLNIWPIKNRNPTLAPRAGHIRALPASWKF
jgi:hypothetical protein